MESNHSCEVTEIYAALGVNIYGKCSVKHNSVQHAAIDAMIDNLELPLMSGRDFCGPELPPAFCVKPDDALKLSIVGIIGTYIRASNVIFFTPQDEDMSTVLKSICRARNNVCPGSTTGISADKSNGGFRVTSYDTDVSIHTQESNMITMVKQLCDADRSITFYLDQDASMYATYMHNNINSMWITRTASSIHMIGSHGSEVMSEMYATPCSMHTLRLNVGRCQVETQSLDSIQYKVNAINSGVMSAMSRDGLCYCCAYMKRVHSVFCSEKVNYMQPFETKLLTDFIEEPDQ